MISNPQLRVGNGVCHLCEACTEKQGRLMFHPDPVAPEAGWINWFVIGATLAVCVSLVSGFVWMLAAGVKWILKP